MLPGNATPVVKDRGSQRYPLYSTPLGVMSMHPQGWAAPWTTHQDSLVREVLQLPIPGGVEDHREGLVRRLNVAQLHLVLRTRETPAVEATTSHACLALGTSGKTAHGRSLPWGTLPLGVKEVLEAQRGSTVA